MTDINIPGDELQTASTNMSQVLQLFGNTNTAGLDLESALGPGETLVSGTAKDFNSRWSDGQSKMKDDGQQIIDAINKIISTFTDTDNNLGNQLTPDPGSSSS